MFKRLKKKFIFLNMAMMSIVMIIAFITIYLLTVNNVENQNKLKLDNASSNSIKYLEEQESQNDYKEIYVGDFPSDYFLQAYNVLVYPSGEVQFKDGVGAYTKDIVVSIVNAALNNKNLSNKIKIADRKYQYLVTPMYRTSSENSSQPEQYQFISFIDITDSENMLIQLLITFIIMGILLIFAIFIISVYFAKRSVAPIEESYNKHKQFIADASHELKTPISSVSANIDALKSNPNETIDSQRKWISYIELEIERMKKLIGNLLCLAKNESNEYETNLSSTNISEILNNAILTMETIAFEKGIVLKEKVTSNIVINCEQEKLEQVFKILLDNAIKYVDDKGTIEIILKETKSDIVFSISNTGDGIESKHIDKVFDRFYRADESRKGDGSYGLGLSIAKAIIDNMKGTISVKSIQGELTVFTVTLNK